MKKILSIIMLIAVLSTLAACKGEAVPGETETAEGAVNETVGTETDATETEENTESAESETEERAPEQPDAEVLSMVKYFSQTWEWDDEILLALSEYNGVVLSEEAKQAYPELAEALEQGRNMMVRTMEDEYDNLLSTAKDELALLGEDSFVTKLSTADVQIRRADSTAVSYLTDSYLVYGSINGRFLQGTTFDTASGKQLTLGDIITDMSRIPEIVKNELAGYTWTGDFFTETAVEDYFRDTPEDGFVWTLDYNGVTFYFGNNTLAETGEGCLAATVSFAAYPELFSEKYMAVPASYIVELPLNHPYYTDLDGDGDLEELTAVPFSDETGLVWESLGFYTDTMIEFYHVERQADTVRRTGGYHVYYVKTADGGSYLYVFAEGSGMAAEDMELCVIDCTDGSFTIVDDAHLAPGYVPVDQSRALTDPDNMMLENFAEAQGVQVYRVGDNGMPVQK